MPINNQILPGDFNMVFSPNARRGGIFIRDSVHKMIGDMIVDSYMYDPPPLQKRSLRLTRESINATLLSSVISCALKSLSSLSLVKSPLTSSLPRLQIISLSLYALSSMRTMVPPPFASIPFGSKVSLHGKSSKRSMITLFCLEI